MESRLRRSYRLCRGGWVIPECKNPEKGDGESMRGREEQEKGELKK